MPSMRTECSMMEGSPILDMRGLPSRTCVCGSDTFKVVVQLAEDNSIAAYTLNGYCYACGAAVTIPTPEESNDQ